MSDPRFEAGPPFSEKEIGEIENALGRTLPVSYRTFVTEYGGAFVGGSVDGSEELPILRFLTATHGGGVMDALAKYSDLKDDGVCPVARCELGNIYVLDRAGVVHYINYYGGKTTSLRVAEDFQDFVYRIVVSND